MIYAFQGLVIQSSNSWQNQENIELLGSFTQQPLPYNNNNNNSNTIPSSCPYNILQARTKKSLSRPFSSQPRWTMRHMDVGRRATVPFEPGPPSSPINIQIQFLFTPNSFPINYKLNTLHTDNHLVVQQSHSPQ
jgi:hypothetical protein